MSKRTYRRWTEAQKAVAVARVAAGESIYAVARDLACARTLVRRWLRTADLPPRRVWDDATRAAAVARMLAGETPTVVARDLGCARSLVWGWLNDAVDANRVQSRVALPPALVAAAEARAQAPRDLATRILEAVCAPDAKGRTMIDSVLSD